LSPAEHHHDEMIRIQISKWRRLVTWSKVREVVISTSKVSIFTRRGNRSIPLDSVEAIECHSGLFWHTLRLRIRQEGRDDRVSIRGIGKESATRFMKAWGVFGHADRLIDAFQDFERLFRADAYFTHHAFSSWMMAYGHLRQYIAASNLDSLPADLCEAVQRLQQIFKDGRELVTERNDHYVERLLGEYKAWFDTQEKFPLTPRQREAIAIDENNCLAVAGAGTGKTSVVIGKVGFILERKLFKPEEILLLAFSRKAKTEIEERILSKFNAPLQARTFHSLGLEIVAAVEKRKPSLSILSEDEKELENALHRYLMELLKDPFSAVQLIEYFTHYLIPYRSDFEFPTHHEYIQYLKAHDIRSLKGEKVKSLEESVIANWFFLNGIPYNYEKDYKFNTATLEFRQYKPDFYLPESEIYLEHFGVDRNGKTAPWVDQEKYWEGIEWKRKVHEEHGTTLIETYSYQYKERTLLSELEARLIEKSVEIRPLSQEEIIKALDANRSIPILVLLLKSFLNLFRGSHLSIDDLRKKAKERPDAERALAFVDIFARVNSKYEAELQASGEIDFNGMIGKAANYVRSGKYPTRFKYIIVDEFQDISQGRYNLLGALLDRIPDRRLLSVGDDWQSIYRFTGSDLCIMKDFEDHFGYTKKVSLDQAFRFNQELLDFSSRFILKNPLQIKKSLRAHTSLGGPAIRVITAKSGETGERQLKEALSEIQGREGSREVKVLLIGRYNHMIPHNLSALKTSHPSLKLSFMSAHSSKGLEADYAILLGMVSGKYGFPTEIVDDPMLDLVLSEDSVFPNAEERRLFYVAVTRAKKMAFLITHEITKSGFIEEIEDASYRHLVSSDRVGSTAVRCSRCNGGLLVLRKGNFRPFWGCSNYPFCDATSEVCFTCKEGVMLRNEKVFVCSRQGCGETAPLCPSCKQGMLIVKDGRHGPFLGCTNWRAKGLSCSYTEELRFRQKL